AGGSRDPAEDPGVDRTVDPRVDRAVDRTVAEDAAAAMADRRTVDRRSLLRVAGVLTVGSVVAGGASRFVSQGRRTSAPPLTLPAPAAPAGPAPASARLDVAGLTAWQTPNDEFYRIDTAFLVPQVDPA